MDKRWMLVIVVAVGSTFPVRAAEGERSSGPAAEPFLPRRADVPADHPLSRYPNPDDPIPQAVIAGIKRDALNGKADAALWLSYHYIDSVSNVPEGEFWLRLAAELGDCDARSDYRRYLRASRSKAEGWMPALRPDACADAAQGDDVGRR